MLAFYARVSKKEQKDADALDRQLWQLRKACKLFSEKDEWTEFIDVQSGRKDDRPEYQKLHKLLLAGRIKKLVITRIDRIGRDLEANARLAKLFEKTGVEIYEILLGRSLDFSNPNDWDYFVRSGLKAEGESRMLSARIKQTFDWHREQGKPTGGRVGWPYRRDNKGFIELDPEQWPLAVALIKILLDEGGTTSSAYYRMKTELKLNFSRLWLHRWARSPLLRGHTCRNTKDDSGRNRKPSEITTVRNTHASLFEEPELAAINAEVRLKQLLEEHGRKKGNAMQHTDYPLSGLLRCGRCGAGCHIRRCFDPKYPNKVYVYVQCSGRSMRMESCGGKYNTTRSKRVSVNSNYAQVETAVIRALCDRAEALVKLTAAEHTAAAAMTESPAIIKEREAIARYEAMADPDLAEVVAKKKANLNRLLLEQDNPNIKEDQVRQQMLIQYTSQPFFWKEATDAEKKRLYHEWVKAVYCDRCDITVELKV